MVRISRAGSSLCYGEHVVCSLPGLRSLQYAAIIDYKGDDLSSGFQRSDESAIVETISIGVRVVIVKIPIGQMRHIITRAAGLLISTWPASPLISAV